MKLCKIHPNVCAQHSCKSKVVNKHEQTRSVIFMLQLHQRWRQMWQLQHFVYDARRCNTHLCQEFQIPTQNVKYCDKVVYHVEMLAERKKRIMGVYFIGSFPLYWFNTRKATLSPECSTLHYTFLGPCGYNRSTFQKLL